MPVNTNKRISYFQNDNIPQLTYGQEHPMKPKRIAMTHELLVSYEVYRYLNVYQPHYATFKEMSLFHDPEYLQFLELSAFKLNNFGPQEDNLEKDKILNDPVKQMTYKIGQNTDCPSFFGLYDYCQISAGASFDCAVLLAENYNDVCINWFGGMHHAKRQEAAGFCYVNDIVICILYLLQYFLRVLYIDVDVHHGDGVEEAFSTTNRVMTLSFHEFGEGFFPGTGSLQSNGHGKGKYYSLNCPLKAGINDEQYTTLFKNVVTQTLSYYRPNAIVLQCGADSLTGDKLGHFNLSTMAHGECVSFILNTGIPLIMLGGGGYTIENVARCWTYETALALNQKLDDMIPINDKYLDEYKNGNFKLHIFPKSDAKNENTKQDLEKIQEHISNTLKQMEHAPGSQFYEKHPFAENEYFDYQMELLEEEYDQLESVGKDISETTGRLESHKIQSCQNISIDY